MQSGWIEIVFLAMLAAFIGLRLYHVLGRRTDAERPEPRNAERGHLRPVSSPDFRAGQQALPAADAGIDAPRPDLDIPPGTPPSVRHGLERIAEADRDFAVERFLSGARAAYGMVLEAFWGEDKDQLADLVSDEMLTDFAAVIDGRQESGERLDNRLIAIDNVEIISAGMSGTMADVTVRFTAEIVTVVRDAEGRIVSGDPNQGVETHDLWTFSRHTASPDPAWIIVATDEEA